jgi:SAM-dependent methyltransferase
MNPYSPKEYWTDVAETFCSADAAGLAPVLHPGAPIWFNQQIDDLQRRAVQRALTLAVVASGESVLDVGCGTGRWVRRFQELGLQATGVDATAPMLRLARKYGTLSPLLAGEAFRLPFADAAFDCVSDITVVQHIPRSLQPKALAEMLRVLKPGGRLILMELIRGRDKHIFPRTPNDWIQQVTECGADLVGWFGQEFLLLDRLFVRIVQAIAGRNGSHSRSESIPGVPASARSSPARRAYWGIRHITVPFSAWTDSVCEKTFPARFATHGVFVFRK